MDYPALIAALPAATIAAVATTPQGLTTAATQVYVADEPRKAAGSVEAWWRHIGPELLEEGMGATLAAQVFGLRIEKVDGTRAELEVWAKQIRDAFHGLALPSGITGLIAARVRDLVYDLHPGEGPAVAMEATIAFVGTEAR